MIVGLFFGCIAWVITGGVFLEFYQTEFGGTVFRCPTAIFLLEILRYRYDVFEPSDDFHSRGRKALSRLTAIVTVILRYRCDVYEPPDQMIKL